MDTPNAVMPFVSAAISAYGTGVLAKTAELAADTPDARGARILQRVFGRGDAYSRQVIERVALAKPDDEPSHTALKLAIMEAFEADPILSQEIAAMLPRAAATAGVDRWTAPEGDIMH
ncbi:hypothetical protein [Nonomuraea jiangxiensis]|uniref:Uncharacterized protein n=1 Tax=Nonomuraea jiangxiensis TaxID=633440 RepID=A0A1G9DIC5_9ACTN|nr:hypothetical protein [Nonomuraea jiangxiensis]SDK63637.1 hypothetical protein SAMN05421869_117151 [Nonomuraea jiangxiensis]